MLSVPVHKDVTEYQPKVIGGLTARTIICIGAAVGCALAFGMLCTFVFHVDINDVIYLVWLAAAPAALVGFYTPHGLNFEKFAPLWLAHNFNEQCLVYVSASNRGEFKAEADALNKAYADERKCAESVPHVFLVPGKLRHRQRRKHGERHRDRLQSCHGFSPLYNNVECRIQPAPRRRPG